MNLPIRIVETPGPETVLSVDGAIEAPGLNLSHWPGNRTPAALKRDLSTGITLAFAALPSPERERLSQGCQALINDHYDTDGALAMFAVLQPEQALARTESMLAAAAAGDFFSCPSEAAFLVDSILTAFPDPDRSPFSSELAGEQDTTRYEIATSHALSVLPSLLDGEFEPFESLWRGPLDNLRADLRDLGQTTIDELVHLDHVVWNAPAGLYSSREDGGDCFDPGRHALWGERRADRQLVVGPGPGGTTFRFLIGTRSFFDLVTETIQPRPDLAALTAQLNTLEGTAPDDEVTWRHQDQEGASPELWFGREGLGKYGEHAGPWLAQSALDPARVKSAVVDALRATWVWPEEDGGDEAEAAGSSADLAR